MVDARLNYKKKKEIWDKLVSPDSEMSVFESYPNLFVLAACTGFVKDKRKPLSEDSDKGETLWEFYSKEEKMAINSIALAESSDPKLLIDSEKEYLEKKVEIAEEYANGGIEILKNELLEKPGSPLDNLILYMNKVSKLEKEKGYLEELEDEF